MREFRIKLSWWMALAALHTQSYLEVLWCLAHLHICRYLLSPSEWICSFTTASTFTWRIWILEMYWKQDWKKLTFPDARLLAWQHTGWLQPHRYLPFIFWGTWFVIFIPFHSCIDFVSFLLTFGWELNTWLWEHFPATCKFITQLWKMKQSVKADQSLAQNSELVNVINVINDETANARTRAEQSFDLQVAELDLSRGAFCQILEQNSHPNWAKLTRLWLPLGVDLSPQVHALFQKLVCLGHCQTSQRTQEPKNIKKWTLTGDSQMARDKRR